MGGCSLQVVETYKKVIAQPFFGFERKGSNAQKASIIYEESAVFFFESIYLPSLETTSSPLKIDGPGRCMSFWGELPVSGSVMGATLHRLIIDLSKVANAAKVTS